MDLRTIIRLAKSFDALGWSVQEQLEEFVDDDGAEVNANAVRLFRDWIKDVQRAAVRAQDTELVLDTSNTLDLIENYLS